MKGKSLLLQPLNSEKSSNQIVRSCIIKRVDSGKVTSQDKLWFKFSSIIPYPKDNDCDAYLLAMLMDAMQENRNIIIKGSISINLLRNLNEYQRAWHKWLPDIYHIINIEAENIKFEHAQKQGAICAFSGGVDSTFSLWQSIQNISILPKINTCLLIHGFDIPLTDIEAFKNTKDSIKKTLNNLDAKLESIVTNYREISKSKWEFTHAAALAATLSNFKNISGHGIIGSSKAYNELHIPWGSNPITDHLLSSDEFTITHHGATHTRIEKVSDICKWKDGLNNLRVCWQGDDKDKNCGKCEKCLRTIVNILSTGTNIPECFPVRDINTINKQIRRLYIEERMQYDWTQSLDYAEKLGIKGSWIQEVKKLVKRKKLHQRLFPNNSYRKKLLTNIRCLLNN